MHSVKDELIQVATNTVQKAGLDALTMRELGEAVGIKSSSVMYHFKNKDGIINEILEHYSQEFFNELMHINLTYKDKKERLDKFVDIFENVLTQNKLCLCGMLAAENENIDALSIENTQDFFTKTQAWIIENLTEGSSEMAKVIISSLEGAMLLDKLYGNTERITAVREWIQKI